MKTTFFVRALFLAGLAFGSIFAFPTGAKAQFIIEVDRIANTLSASGSSTVTMTPDGSNSFIQSGDPDIVGGPAIIASPFTSFPIDNGQDGTFSLNGGLPSSFTAEDFAYVFDGDFVGGSGTININHQFYGAPLTNFPGIVVGDVLTISLPSAPLTLNAGIALLNQGSFLFVDRVYGLSWLYNIIDVVPELAPLGGVGPTKSTPTILATNIGAIVSTTATGLSSMGTTLNTVQKAAQNAVGDLNSRLFSARSGGNGNGGGVASTLDSGTSRYLNFAQSQKIDYRVALGLADGKEIEIVDTLSGAGHPLAMVGVPAVTGSAVIAVEGGSGKNSVTDKVVIEDVPQTKYEVFTQFDYGYYDQDNLTRNYRGFEVDSYAGSAGLQYRLTDWLVAGAAYTYLNSDTNSTANLGSSDLEGNLLSGYATAFYGNTYLDVLYSYGDFDNDISRNTLLGRTAYGDTESQSHNIAANLGHTFDVTEKFSFGPSAGLNYTTGEVDGYAERNGGLANLIYPDHDFESMIGRLGGYATYKMDTAAGLLTTQASAGWAHEFMPENGNVTASLETSPFALVTGNNFRSIGDYTASEERAHAGTDWLELGLTSRLDIKNTDFNVQLGYQGMFGRNNASGHFASAKIGYEW